MVNHSMRVVLMMFGASLVLLAGCSTSMHPSGVQEELATSSDQTDAQKRARIRLQLAIGYYEQRQLNTALDEVKLALAADPNFSDAYSVRALIYMDLGETRLAEDNFLQAIRLAPNNPDLSSNYGWFLCQNDRAQQAIPYFESALKNKTYQSPAKALNNAGVCSMKIENTAAAERYLLEAFQLEPGNASTNVNLAKVLYKRRDFERARFYIARVVKTDALTADVLWTGIKIERKLNDRAAEVSLVTQLRRRYPNSSEYAAYQRGAFDE